MKASYLSVPAAGSNGGNSDGVNGKVSLVKKRRERKVSSCAATLCRAVLQNKARAAVSPARTATLEGVSDGGEENVSLPPPAIALDVKVGRKERKEEEEVEERKEKQVAVVVENDDAVASEGNGTKNGGNDFTTADLSSEPESEPTAHPVNDVNYASDATTVCDVPSNMEETETNNPNKQSSVQEKKRRIRFVPSRYMAAPSRPLAAASKRYPSPAVGQSMRMEPPQPPPRALSAERRRPSTGYRPFEENQIPRSGRTLKPVSTPGPSQTMGLWARTNSLPSRNSVDAKAVSDATGSECGLSRNRPLSAQKAISGLTEHDSSALKTRLSRVGAGGAQRHQSNISATCRVDVQSNGVLTDGRNLNDQTHSLYKRPGSSNSRLVGGALSRSVDLSVSGGLFPGNRRNSTQQPRSRSTTRGGVLELKNMSSSVIQENTATRGNPSASRTQNNRYTGTGKVGNCGHQSVHVEKPTGVVKRGGVQAGDYRDNEGDFVAVPLIASATASGGPCAAALAASTASTASSTAAPAAASAAASTAASTVASTAVSTAANAVSAAACTAASTVASSSASADEMNRYVDNLEVTLNNDASCDEGTSVGSESSDRGIDQRGGSLIGEMQSGPGRGSANGTDGLCEQEERDTTECCTMERGGRLEGRSNKENRAGPFSNRRRTKRTNATHGTCGTLGESRGLGARQRLWDTNSLQKGGSGGSAAGGGIDSQPQGGNAADAKEKGTNAKSGAVGRRTSDGVAVSNVRTTGTSAVAAKTGLTSSWRSNSFSGNSSAAASAWAQSPGRGLSQQLVGTTGLSSLAASPPVKPLSGQAGPLSPLLTPPGVTSSPGLRPRSAYVEGNKSRSILTASPSHTAAATIAPPICHQMPVTSNMNPQMLARHVRVLHNRWLQWRFLNAKQEALAKAQQNIAETALYSAWVSTAELRTSVTLKRIQLQRAKQAQRLDGTLAAHATRLEEWTEIRQEHTSCFGGAIEALETAMRQVPLVNGAKADVESMRSLVASATELMDAVNPSMNGLLPKVESTESLLSQLAEVVRQERALLEECGELLSAATMLEVEERSLRAHHLQLEHEWEREQLQNNDGDVQSSISAPEVMGSSCD